MADFQHIQADPVKAIVLVLNNLHRICFPPYTPQTQLLKTNDQNPTRNSTTAETTVPMKAIP